MPIIKSININHNRLLAIWKVEESIESLLTMLAPGPEDRELLFSFKNEKKQYEWLGGRLTLKHLSSQLNIPYKGIKKDEHGKPTLKSSDAEISLTHSFPYVAAIIDRTKPVGIDLEQPRDKVLRIAHKFLNDDELNFAENNVRMLNIMWCVKETLYKIYGKKGLSFREHLQIKPFNTTDLNTITGNIIVNDTSESYKLQYRDESDYILTYNV